MPDVIVFQTYADLEGYLWSFPRADHASVGIATRLGAAVPRDLWKRVDQYLDEVCPEADKLDSYSALLPMAQDASLWDSPCAGSNWALLGDAAGHVHPLTGEGIAYALWSAELLDASLGHRGPLAYEGLWQERYGNRLRAASTMLSSSGGRPEGYEIAFQIVMAVASSIPSLSH